LRELESNYLLLKPVLTPSGNKLFSINPVQVLLTAIMLGIITALITVSFVALQAITQTRETLLAEESDASALVFVQRESFGLIIEIEEHLLGQSPIQDVLLARSTLTQRLNVITSSGQSTFTVAGENYRAALREMDKFIVSQGPLKNDTEFRDAADNFLTQARLLADIFQQISRANIQSAVSSQALLDLWQGILALISLLIGASLFIWIVRDLRNGFRAGYSELKKQSEAIEAAAQDFLALGSLDKQIAEWNDRVTAGENLQEIVAEAKRKLTILVDGNLISIANQDSELVVGENNFNAVETRKLLESRLQELISKIQIQGESRDQLEFERYHCSLTGLLNRRGLTRELISRIQVDSKEPILLFDIDIDGFTSLNNAMGQSVGDEILIEFASRLAALELPDARIARVTADQFVLLTQADYLDLDEIIQMVTSATQYESSIGQGNVNIRSCMGWHLVEPGETYDEAAAKVATALRAARSKGKTGVIVRFSSQEHGHLLTEYFEQMTIRLAMANGEVISYLQPIVNLKTREIKGYEALARWVKPDRSVLTAAKFLPTITQGGLLDELFEVILESVAKNWVKFSAKNPGVYIGINVDPKTLDLPNFANLVLDTVNKFQVDPKLLVLEITEQSLLEASSIDQLMPLRAMGIRISLDDFGIGYSNLSRISSLPIDIVKLDRSFLNDGINTSSIEILKTIKQLAVSSNLKVVVEGIEHEDLAQELSELGFEFGQGYLFGIPENLFSD